MIHAHSLGRAAIYYGERTALISGAARPTFLAWLGLIAVPVNTRLSITEVDHLIADASPRGLIRHSSCRRAAPAKS
jgi:hypothetical protein